MTDLNAEEGVKFVLIILTI